MNINYRPLTLLILILMSHGISQANEPSELTKDPTVKDPEIIKEIPPKKISAQCIKPAQIVDIWRLEPLLIQEGLIKQSMNKDQRRIVIQEYIRNKNSQYSECRNKNKTDNGSVDDLGKECEKPSFSIDDSKVEALLIENNQIDQSMNEQQRQNAVQMYKNKMMAQYRLCIMSSKKIIN